MRMRHFFQSVSINSRWADASCVLLLARVVVPFFFTSPQAGDFWQSDAPRHAMDEISYHDMACATPITHAKQWAINYYLQYPAVTVLTYPPLFALVEAVFFALFGVSHYGTPRGALIEEVAQPDDARAIRVRLYERKNYSGSSLRHV